MVYEIWDLESRNAVGDFDTRDEALAEVAAMVQRYGVTTMLPWALERVDGEDVTSVAEGAELIALALAVARRAAGGSGPVGPSTEPGAAVAQSTPPADPEPGDDDIALGLGAPEDDDSLARGLPMTDWNALVERYVDPAVSSDAELRRILNEVTPERRAWFKTIARVKLHDQDVAGNPFNQGGVVRVTTEDDPITRAGKLLELNERKRQLIRGW